MRILSASGLGGPLLACGRHAAAPCRPSPDPASAFAAESPIPPLRVALRPELIQPLTHPRPAQVPAALGLVGKHMDMKGMDPRRKS